MKKRTLVIIICCLAVFCSGAVLYGLPYATVYRIISALKDRDVDRLVRLVDFPRVQAGMKEQIRAVLPPASGGGDWDRIRQTVTAKLFDTAVEQMATPEGMIALFKQNLSEAAGASSADRKAASGSESALSIFAAVLWYADCAYRSPSEFTIGYDDREGRTIRFRLARSGLAWRLVHIQIPVSGTPSK